MPDKVPTIDQPDRSEGGNATAEGAQDKAREVASEAQEKAGDAAGQARGAVREQVNRRSTQVGERVSSSAADVRAVADELRKRGKGSAAGYAEQVGDRAERLGGYLREGDADRILSDVEDFSRRNAWAVAVGGLALGFAASRLLKASSGERYRSSLGATSTGIPAKGGGLAPAESEASAGTSSTRRGTRPGKSQPHSPP
jgi:hypothetical protein